MCVCVRVAEGFVYINVEISWGQVRGWLFGCDRLVLFGLVVLYVDFGGSLSCGWTI